ncbi:phage tail protein [Testudinibacter sp. TR-2022]|uniref:phage tail sheath subtilisin-like domain-containing protein n=1 Tax=Testudinibacter sp. TR-2022 TaxID=2585029 RepID=UPI00111BA132|nr:phage tail sheath subtilisin-like domain-containing protein [Testudinibacter sp. TR-2022]TNH04522.1 phage tail protein [Pasteurellaceae bacterium Phil31]TNH11956.1 phage tail protein [Testudinibacter sp. TR-2022]TNH12739.1 phage tail protein [Testudinibacter sp. TR-2022]
MAISYNQIPNNIRVPLAYIEFDNTKAVSGTPQMLQKILMIGQKLATGTATTGSAVRVSSYAQAKVLFGRGSQLAKMVNVFRKHNDYSDLWVLPLDDKTGSAAATGKIKLVGKATQAGALSVMVAGVNYKFAVAVNDTAAVLATKLAAAINADGDNVVNATVTTDTVAVTARFKGECGNDIDIRTNYYSGESYPVGIAAEITAMAGGAVNPDMATAITGFGAEWWNYIINPFTDTESLNLLRTELVNRWGPLKQIDGTCFMAKRGTHGTVTTFTEQRNDYLMSTLATNITPEPAYEWAAAVGAVASYYLAIDPARPLQTLVLNMLPPAMSDRWDLPDRNTLLFSGASTYTVNDNSQPQIEALITMYRKNSLGDNDPSYLYVETIATLSYIRYAIRTRISQKYPRHKLADDGIRVSPGQAIVTPKVIKSELLALFTELEFAGLVEDYENFEKSLLVERDQNDRNRLNVLSNENLVNQFRIYAHAVQFIL